MRSHLLIQIVIWWMQVCLKWMLIGVSECVCVCGEGGIKE